MTNIRITPAQALVLRRSLAGARLVQSCVGERLWTLEQDPFTLLDGVAMERLRTAGLIVLTRRGSQREDRADAYDMTGSGQAALAAHDADSPGPRPRRS